MADKSIVNLAKKIVDIAGNLKSNKPSAYDIRGTVRRVENGVAYVHFNGGIDETPVEVSLSVLPGDDVQVRVANGRAWITGNFTAPPTDDRVAIQANNRANSALKKAEKAENDITNVEISKETSTITSNKVKTVRIPKSSVSTGVTVDGWKIFVNTTPVVSIPSESMTNNIRFTNYNFSPQAYIKNIKVLINNGESQTELALQKIWSSPSAIFYDVERKWYGLEKRYDVDSHYNNSRIPMFSSQVLAEAAVANAKSRYCPVYYRSGWTLNGDIYYGKHGYYNKSGSTVLRGYYPGTRTNVMSGGFYSGPVFTSSFDGFVHHELYTKDYSPSDLHVVIKSSKIPSIYDNIEIQYEVV